jgi:putative drug exporter of the RND superfamily
VHITLAYAPGIDAASVTQPVTNGDLAYLQATLTDPPDSTAAYNAGDRARQRQCRTSCARPG